MRFLGVKVTPCVCCCVQVTGRGGGENEGPDGPAGGTGGVHPEDTEGEAGAETGNGGQVPGPGGGTEAAGGGPRQPAQG